MNDNNLETSMYVVVANICKQLTLPELHALNLCVQLGLDPHGRLFNYDAVSMLFSEQDGTVAHSLTKDAVAACVNQRMKEENGRC